MFSNNFLCLTKWNKNQIMITDQRFKVALTWKYCNVSEYKFTEKKISYNCLYPTCWNDFGDFYLCMRFWDEKVSINEITLPLSWWTKEMYNIYEDVRENCILNQIRLDNPPPSFSMLPPICDIHSNTLYTWDCKYR